MPPSNDEPDKGETQAVFTTAISMSESEILALEARVRAVGGASGSPFSSRSPCGQASTSLSQAISPVPQTHSPCVADAFSSCIGSNFAAFMRVRIQVFHGIYYDQSKVFIYVDTSNRILMKKDMVQVRPSRFITSRFFMMSMDRIESQLKRCRVLKFMHKFEGIFKWQITTAEHVEE